MRQRSSTENDTASHRTLATTPFSSPDLLRRILDISEDAICLIDRVAERITYANQVAERLFGYTGREWEAVTLADLLSEDDKCPAQPMAEFVESHVRHRDGHVLSLRWCVVGSLSDDIVAVIFRSIASVGPISKADCDPLTGLVNRRVLEFRLQEAIERQDEGFAVLFMDLDDFKDVNDRFGHPGGDHVLRCAAERLVHCLRPVDTVARYGGDEFVVLLERIGSLESAKNAAGRLLNAIGMPVDVEGSHIRISASVGIVLGNQGIRDVATAVRLADRAMYRAKALGRRRYVVFDEKECPPFSARREKDSASRQDR